MNLQTADLLDQHEDAARSGAIRVLAPILTHFGGRRHFAGPIATLRLFEDNSLVRKALETPGNGRVLVVDGAGSLRCALVGDQLARLAVTRAWSGIVVHGCIRDSHAIGAMDIGVMALATHPLKSVKRGAGEADVPVAFGGVVFNPGEWLCADHDGVIVAPSPLA
ncbi:MAG: ribonuclease E activity regulator RraA [Betaproteobacteria bacterium]|nr:ribonuclease E activity regulator RraA [Betaproteobacteria bacterium]